MKKIFILVLCLVLIPGVLAEQVKVEHKFNVTVDGMDIEISSSDDYSLTGDLHLKANEDNGTQNYKIYSYMDSDDIEGCKAECPGITNCNESLRNMSEAMGLFVDYFKGFVNRTEILTNYTNVDGIIAYEKCQATLELKNQKIDELRCHEGNLTVCREDLVHANADLDICRSEKISQVNACEDELENCQAVKNQGYLFGAIGGAVIVYFLMRKQKSGVAEEEDYGEIQ